MAGHISAWAQGISVTSSTSGYRNYRFEVLDLNGFLLTYCVRSWQVTGVITRAASGTYDLYKTRTGTFYSMSTGPIMITDDGYDLNPWDSFVPFDTQKYRLLIPLSYRSHTALIPLSYRSLCLLYALSMLSLCCRA